MMAFGSVKRLLAVASLRSGHNGGNSYWARQRRQQKRV